jgi:hypothetical protein
VGAKRRCAASEQRQSGTVAPHREYECNAAVDCYPLPKAPTAPAGRALLETRRGDSDTMSNRLTL